MNSSNNQDILAQTLVASAKRLRLGYRWKVLTPNMHFNQYTNEKIKNIYINVFSVAVSFSGFEPYWKAVVRIIRSLKCSAWRSGPIILLDITGRASAILYQEMAYPDFNFSSTNILTNPFPKTFLCLKMSSNVYAVPICLSSKYHSLHVLYMCLSLFIYFLNKIYNFATFIFDQHYRIKK